MKTIHVNASKSYDILMSAAFSIAQAKKSKPSAAQARR